MNTIDWESYRSAWKKEPNLNKKKLSKEEMRQFMHSASRNMLSGLKKGVVLDLVLKQLLTVSFVILMVLFSSTASVVGISVLLTLVTILGLAYQISIYKKLSRPMDPKPDLRTALDSLILFYRRHYLISMLVGALSSSLFFLSGSLYYFYFKYKTVRPLQWDDLLVLCAGILLTFAISVLAQVKQQSYQVKQLESCLTDMDEDNFTGESVRRYSSKRLRNLIVFGIAVVAGLLLLTYVVFSIV